MPTIPPVVPHLPIAILELIVNDQAAELTRLGRILGNLRSEAAPLSHLAEIISAAAHRDEELKENARLKQEGIDHWLRILNHDRAFSAFGKHDPFTELPTMGVTRRRRKLNKRAIPKPDIPMSGAISFLPLSFEQCEAAKAKRGMLTFVPGDFVGLEELRQKRYAVKERPSDADRACYEPKWVAENRALLTRHTDQSLLPKMGAPSPSPHDIMTPIVAVCRELRVLAGGKWAASRKEQEPVKFKSARSVEWRRTHSAMGKLMNLCASVTEKMRDDEEYDVWVTVEPMSYKQALSYLRACSRWLIEKKIAGKQARTLKAILSKSRAFAH